MFLLVASFMAIVWVIETSLRWHFSCFFLVANFSVLPVHCYMCKNLFKLFSFSRSVSSICLCSVEFYKLQIVCTAHSHTYIVDYWPRKQMIHFFNVVNFLHSLRFVCNDDFEWLLSSLFPSAGGKISIHTRWGRECGKRSCKIMIVCGRMSAMNVQTWMETEIHYITDCFFNPNNSTNHFATFFIKCGVG